MRGSGTRAGWAFTAVVFTPIAMASLTGCGGGATPPSSVDVSRSTGPSGAVMLDYTGLATAPTRALAGELRIGTLDGDPCFVFGDVRGIAAAADGAIYVLDSQASEIRVFEADGSCRGTISGRGDGPGEITEANGMTLVGDTALWLQDHGKWQMLALATDGTELTRYPMPIRSYGYVWRGTVDASGRMWKEETHPDDPDFEPEPGLYALTARAFYVSYDPVAAQRDSVYLGEVTYRAHMRRIGDTGRSFRGIPNQPSRVTVVAPSGDLWTSDPSTYSIVRLTEHGDTALVITADVAPPPVTDEDRAAYVAESLERDPNSARVAEEIAAAMPETRPAISGLAVDDEGNVWVRRGQPEDEAPIYDVFARDGEYIGTLELDFVPASYLAPVVRHGRLYALVPDALDVPYVVRAELPF